jgi:anaerobic magnesium-protoporphyrin IX monomethyl ester cyclase
MRVLLVVYDNGAFVHSFPQGTAYVAAALRNAGHEVSIWSQDVHHWPDEQLTTHLDENDFDVVGIGIVAGYYQYKRMLGLARAVNAARKRPYFILGGYGPTPEPEYFLKITQADAVVLGEGEETAVDLLEALEKKTPLTDVLGIAFREEDKITVNPRRALANDLTAIIWPAYDLFPMSYYRLMRFPHMEPTEFSMVVLSGRGCTFKCTFCYRMDTGYRPRDYDSIFDEVEYLQKTYQITHIDFCDDLLMSSKVHATEFCDAVMRRGIKFKWSCNGRLNYVTADVLDLMKRAGCTFINYGIESVDNTVLKNMKKGLRYEQIINGVELTLASGISPGLNIIWGNIGDTLETLDRSVEFLLKYDDHAQMRTIRPVTPYPGSPLYYDAIEKGLLKDVADFYENKHLNSDLLAVNFTDLSDEDFHAALYHANMRLTEKYFEVRQANVERTMRRLYMENDVTFRGFRHT